LKKVFFNLIIEIEFLNTLPDGMYCKCKEFEIGHYITVIIDKKKLSFEIQLDEESASSLPDFITFLLIVDCQFPTSAPKVLTKTNVRKLFYIYLVLFTKPNGRTRLNE